MSVMRQVRMVFAQAPRTAERCHKAVILPPPDASMRTRQRPIPQFGVSRPHGNWLSHYQLHITGFATGSMPRRIAQQVGLAPPSFHSRTHCRHGNPEKFHCGRIGSQNSVVLGGSKAGTPFPARICRASPQAATQRWALSELPFESFLPPVQPFHVQNVLQQVKELFSIT
jgi:hypothetical protein